MCRSDIGTMEVGARSSMHGQDAPKESAEPRRDKKETTLCTPKAPRRNQGNRRDRIADGGREQQGVLSGGVALGVLI